LAEFASVVDAVQCAVVIQTTLKAENANLSPGRRMEFRIGINLGDVMVEGEQIYGDGVNIAARMESLAEAGCICISGTVHEHVKNKLTLQYEDLGEQVVKNIAEPVRVFRVLLGVPSPRGALINQGPTGGQGEEVSRKAESPRSQVPSPKIRRVGMAHRHWAVATVGGLLLIVGAIVAVRYLFPPTPSTQPSTLSTQPPLSTQDSALRTESAPAALPLPDKPSIVILPFDNMSGDSQQDYFSNGITEVLTSDLSRISSLFVIARNTAFTYKGKAANVQEVGKELGVRYVLEGSIQKASEQVRIVAQLIDTTTGGHLWSQRYDRPLKDIFALQDEIVQKIVTTLKLQLTLEEQGFIVRKHTGNLEAYDVFLRGVESFWRLTKEANAQARQMYEKAIALDPQYAEAYAWLSSTYYMQWIWRWNADSQTLERGLVLAQQALALDDSLPTAHSLLSSIYMQKQQYDQAIAEGERAIALDPNNADSYAWQAEVLNLAGRPAEALRVVEQAMRLNPRYPPFYLLELGLAYRLTGRYAEAVATQKEAISRNPDHFGAHSNLALGYLQQWSFQLSPDPQTLAQALAEAQRVIALNETSPWGHGLLGGVYLWQKQYDQAITEMERACALDLNSADSAAGLAEMLSRVGRSEEALRMVEQALRRKPLIVDGHLGIVGSAYYLAGRPEEAIAPLKQFLARFPNLLGAHLTLAAVYSELGREAEARAEGAEVLRLNPKFSLEVHKQRAPIKDPAVLERHLAALRRAGLK
ncbi:MAG: tetratricopeptide repeat protein, partial [Deltaproteobacteria bacterium]|nr:tetratricopeptide repeat protein [Deltaproteobacteria bacterium]